MLVAHSLSSGKQYYRREFYFGSFLILVLHLPKIEITPPPSKKKQLIVWMFTDIKVKGHANFELRSRRKEMLGSQGGGGTYQNSDRDARPIFLGLKFSQVLFSGLANSLAIFLGFTKFPLLFWV